MHNVDEIEKVLPDWTHHRIVHSKYPPKNLFDDDDRINSTLGEVMADTSERLYAPERFVDPLDVRHGLGWGPVMASFCYPRLGRFSNGGHCGGAYYAANSAKTAISEWAHHTARFWAGFGYTDEVSAVVRCYTGRVVLPLLDVRGIDKLNKHDPSYEYNYTRAFSDSARAQGANGVVYRSQRLPGGECIALFRPPSTTPVTQAAHYSCIFDGQRFSAFAKLGALHSI